MTSRETTALRRRWRSPEGQQAASEILARLAAGRPLDDLALGEVDGRIDLRGLVIAAPKIADRREVAGMHVDRLEGLPELEGVRLESLDLSGAVIQSLRLLDVEIADCRFPGSDLRDLRVWETAVVDASFAGSNLRGASLGAWPDAGRPNRYERVDFSGADLRSLSCRAGVFVECDFSRATLAKVDFGASSFTRCRFAGELREVIFYDRLPDAPQARNEMRDVDFSEAQLRLVEFRGLALDGVRLPDGGDHLLVANYPCVLKAAVRELAGHRSEVAAGLRAVLETELEWLDARREVGVFHRADFREGPDGDEELRLLEETLARATAECEGQSRAKRRGRWLTRGKA